MSKVKIAAEFYIQRYLRPSVARAESQRHVVNGTCHVSHETETEKRHAALHAGLLRYSTLPMKHDDEPQPIDRPTLALSLAAVKGRVRV